MRRDVEHQSRSGVYANIRLKCTPTFIACIRHLQGEALSSTNFSTRLPHAGHSFLCTGACPSIRLSCWQGSPQHNVQHPETLLHHVPHHRTSFGPPYPGPLQQPGHSGPGLRGCHLALHVPGPELDAKIHGFLDATGGAVHVLRWNCGAGR